MRIVPSINGICKDIQENTNLWVAKAVTSWTASYVSTFKLGSQNPFAPFWDPSKFFASNLAFVSAVDKCKYTMAITCPYLWQRTMLKTLIVSASLSFYVPSS